MFDQQTVDFKFKDKIMSWTYKQHEIGDITQFPENTFGFVYLTTHIPTGKAYIGKKVLFHVAYRSNS